MDNFKVIYKILKYLESAMDYSEPDYEPISAAALGLTEERWRLLMKMLTKNGYIDGVVLKQYMRARITVIRFNPEITLRGLEYLHENSMMKKAMEVAKGITDIIPGM